MYESKKSSGTLRITNAEGKALAGVKLHVEQTSHDFLFGCGAFATVWMPACRSARSVCRHTSIRGIKESTDISIMSEKSQDGQCILKLL